MGNDDRGVPHFRGEPEPLETPFWAFLLIMAGGCAAVTGVAGVYQLSAGRSGGMLVLTGISSAFAWRAFWWLRMCNGMPDLLTVEGLAGLLLVDGSELDVYVRTNRLRPRLNLDGADLYEPRSFEAALLLRPAGPDERLLRPAADSGTPPRQLVRPAPEPEARRRSRREVP